MSPDISPDVFTVDYTGVPGGRTFYLQSRSIESTHTFVLEKLQAQALAERLRDLLLGVDPDDTVVKTPPARDPVMNLSEPPENPDRPGAIAIGYDETNDRVLVVIEVGDPDEATGADEEALHVSLRRDQVRAFVLHALAIVGEGRDLCQLCGLPMDPAGHDCAARNGHRVGE